MKRLKVGVIISVILLFAAMCFAQYRGRYSSTWRFNSRSATSPGTNLALYLVHPAGDANAGDSDSHILVMQATGDNEQRVYHRWNDVNGNQDWVMGKNYLGSFILYDSVDTNNAHRMQFYPGSDTYFDSAGTGGVYINKTADADTGTGGFYVYSGGANPVCLFTVGTNDTYFYNDLQLRPDGTNQTAYFRDSDSLLYYPLRFIDTAICLERDADANDHTADYDSMVVAITNTDAARTVTLPSDGSAVAGQLIIVKDESGGAGTNNITVAAAGADTIDGASSIVINTDYGCVAFYVAAAGGNWHIAWNSNWTQLSAGTLKSTTDVYVMTKTVIKTINLDSSDDDEDFEFDDSQANVTEQTVDMGAIVPAYAEVLSAQLRCFESVAGSGSAVMAIDIGTSDGGAEIFATADIDSANDISATGAGDGPEIVATAAAKNVWINATPDANWNTLTAGKWSVMITYIDYGAVHTAGI